MKTFIGIADCKGIESFLPLEGNEQRLGILVMRASANRHRHALVYQVEMDEDQEAIFKAVLERGEYIPACAMLHDPAFVENVGVENSMIHSWDMIPNPRLDPYFGRFEEEE
jgi:hypothetical protein